MINLSYCFTMMTNEVKNILGIREIRRNVEKLNRNHCYFEYGELKRSLT